MVLFGHLIYLFLILFSPAYESALMAGLHIALYIELKMEQGGFILSFK